MINAAQKAVSIIFSIIEVLLHLPLKSVQIQLALLLMATFLVAMFCGLPVKAQTETGFPFVKPKDRKIVLRDVNIDGNRRTKRHIILRELDIKSGDTIAVSDTSILFEWNANKVFNTLLFTKAKVGIVLRDDSLTDFLEADLQVAVNERWYTFPNPIFELADRNFNEWWYLRNRDLSRVNYGLRFVQKNFRGRNEEVRIIAQGGFTRQFGLTYVIPYITRKFSEGLRLSASYSTNKSIAFRTSENQLQFVKVEDRDLRRRFNASIAFNKRIGYFENHSFFFDFNRNQVDDTITKLNPRYFENGLSVQRYLQFHYHYTFDKRNIRAYPLKGYFVGLSFNQIGFFEWEDVHITSFRAKGALYRDLGLGFYYAVSADAEISAPQRQPYYLHRSLGYSGRVVRGYEKNVIEGYIPMMMKQSFRKRILKREFRPALIPLEQFRQIPVSIYLKAHADAGYVSNPLVFPENKRLTNTLLGGAGLGLDIVTYYDVVLRFEYSITRQGDKGFFISFESDI